MSSAKVERMVSAEDLLFCLRMLERRLPEDGLGRDADLLMPDEGAVGGPLAPEAGRPVR